MHLDILSLPHVVRARLATMLRQLSATRALDRLWARDASLWHPATATQARIAERLSWLALPDQPPAELALPPWIGAQQHVLFVASEAAQQSIRLWRDLSPAAQRRLRVLNTIDPAVVQHTLAAVDWSRSALVLAAAELTPEMAALADCAVESRALARPDADAPLAVLTAPGSTLAQRYATITPESDAARCWPSQLIAVPPDLGERFGACSAFGLVPAALAGADLERLTGAALRMRAACQQSVDLDRNPGALLGALLGVLAQHGRDKLTLLTPPALAPLAEWIASFVAASLGKHGRGFVPIAGEPLAVPTSYRADRCFVVLRLGNTPDADLDQQVAALRAAGQPLISCTLADRDELLAHLLCWQVAVAVAASIIGVNPFDEPDTIAMRDYIARRLVDGPPATDAPAGRQRAGTLASAVRDALPLLRRSSWVALASYLPPTPQQEVELRALRRLLLRRAGLATVLIYPLRDHAMSVQLLHAGRPDGVVLALTPPPNAPIGPSSQGLAALARTRLAVELAAWRRMGRAVVALELDDDPAAGLSACYAALDRLL